MSPNKIFKKKYPPIGLNDKIPFGKYKGQILHDILPSDIKYFRWCVDTVGLEFKNDAWKNYSALLEELIDAEAAEVEAKQLNLFQNNHRTFNQF